MIVEIKNPKEKQDICQLILDDLPEWFGIKEATNFYINAVKKHTFFTYIHNDEPIGFYALREENEQTLDMFVLGVKKKYHGQKVGQKLQKYVFEYAKKQGYQYCMVLTLSNQHTDVGYQKTRAFYHKMGFIDIYQSNKIWDEQNPAQLMVKKL